jgi:hypothetical protein
MMIYIQRLIKELKNLQVEKIMNLINLQINQIH